MDGLLQRNRIPVSSVSAIATAGGGAAIPLVTQRLSERLQALAITTPYAQVSTAVGAALAAGLALRCCREWFGACRTPTPRPPVWPRPWAGPVPPVPCRPRRRRDRPDAGQSDLAGELVSAEPRSAIAQLMLRPEGLLSPRRRTVRRGGAGLFWYKRPPLLGALPRRCCWPVVGWQITRLATA